MQDIKNFFKFIKDKWKNPKFKGIIQLSFWILFFIIVALILKSAEKRNTKIDKKQEEVVNSYEYNYQFQDQNNKLDISGTYFQGKKVFYMNNNKYYYINNKYYQANNNSLVNINYALNEWDYNSIKSIMDNSEYSNKLEYADDIIKYEYNISNLDYNNYYQTHYNNNIIITVTLKDEIIDSASINYGFGLVQIKYTNINNIKNLDINIEEG